MRISNANIAAPTSADNTPVTPTKTASDEAVTTFQEMFGHSMVYITGSDTPVKSTSLKQPAAIKAAEEKTAEPNPNKLPADVVELFGTKPWMDAPTGIAPDGTLYPFNPTYFATPETAAKVAEIMGGKVVERHSILGPGVYGQSQPNYMVDLPNGNEVNPGLIVTLYTHGISKEAIQKNLLLEMEPHKS